MSEDSLHDQHWKDYEKQYSIPEEQERITDKEYIERVCQEIEQRVRQALECKEVYAELCTAVTFYDLQPSTIAIVPNQGTGTNAEPYRIIVSNGAAYTRDYRFQHEFSTRVFPNKRLPPREIAYSVLDEIAQLPIHALEQFQEDIGELDPKYFSIGVLDASNRSKYRTKEHCTVPYGEFEKEDRDVVRNTSRDTCNKLYALLEKNGIEHVLIEEGETPYEIDVHGLEFDYVGRFTYFIQQHCDIPENIAFISENPAKKAITREHGYETPQDNFTDVRNPEEDDFSRRTIGLFQEHLHYISERCEQAWMEIVRSRFSDAESKNIPCVKVRFYQKNPKYRFETD